MARFFEEADGCYAHDVDSLTPIFDLSFRPYNDADISTLADMNYRLIQDERSRNPMTPEELAERMSGWLSSEYSCIIACKEGIPVAYCLYRDDGEYYCLRQIYNERESRRQGIATALLDWMFANRWQGKAVRLDVLAHNESAMDFYRRYGFKNCVYRLEMSDHLSLT